MGDHLVSIDLGKRVSGIAVFENGLLREAFEITVPCGRARSMAHDIIESAFEAAGQPDKWKPRWVAEKMLDYGSKGGRKANLEQLRQVSRAMADMGCAPELVTARKWKGSITKGVTRIRVLEALALEETYTELTKETVDAIGIGLYVLGRVGRGVTRI